MSSIASVSAGSLATGRKSGALYGISALLMLIGCFLISIPYLFCPSALGPILILLGIINVYEAMVIATCAYIVRSAPESNESSVLLGIELLFLFDATFTINACVPPDYYGGAAACLLSLALAAAKVYALEKGAREPIFGGVRPALFACMAFTYTFQILFVTFRYDAFDVQAVASYFVWLAYGALPLFLLHVRFGSPSIDAATGGATDAPPAAGDSGEAGGLDNGARAEPSSDAPWADFNAVRTNGSVSAPTQHARSAVAGLPWRRRSSFKKAVAAGALLLALAQLVGQAWVHGMPMAWTFLIPLAFSLMAVAPAFAHIEDRRDLAVIRGLALASMASLAIALPDGMRWNVSLFGGSLTLSPLRIGLLWGAGTFWLMWKRDAGEGLLNTALALAALAVLGDSSRSIAWAMVRPELGHAAGIAIVGAIWYSLRRTFARALVVSAVVVWLLAGAAAYALPAGAVAFSFFRMWSAVAFGLTIFLLPRWNPWRCAFASLVFLVGTTAYALDRPDLAVYSILVAVLLAAGAFAEFGRFGSLIASAAYFAVCMFRAYGVPLPRAKAEWGATTIAAAFAVFGLAFLLTRRAIQRARALPAGPAVAPAAAETHADGTNRECD